MSLDEKIPIVIWPRRSGHYKYVIMSYEDHAFLRFGGFSHTDVFMNWILRHQEFGEKIECHGGGWAEINLEEKRVRIYGESLGLGKGDYWKLEEILSKTDFSYKLEDRPLSYILSSLFRRSPHT